MKAGGEEDSLSGAFEKEMSQWTNVVGGGPPTKSKGPLRRGGTFSAPSFIVISSISTGRIKLSRQLFFPLVNDFSQSKPPCHTALCDIHPGAEDLDRSEEGKEIMRTVEELNGSGTAGGRSC